MDNPQPIETAPKDGTVILTDCGVVKFYKPRYVGGPGWILCGPSGWEPDCADNGYFYEQPKLWVPLPEWIKG